MSRPNRTGSHPSTQAIFEELDAMLREAADPERAANEKAYLKSPIEHYGARVPAIRRAVKAVERRYPDLPAPRLLALARRLWKSDVHERRMAAVILLQTRAEDLRPADFAFVEAMIRESFTWAYVDPLAGSVAGALIERYPELTGELDRWAADESFWVRRSALLALLGPIRRGAGDWLRFTRYADGMLAEREFFIRKAIGWVLREASRKRPERVRKYVGARLDRLSGLTFREAIKHLPEAEREELRSAFARRR
ncbi:MAG TPA: DNA alkylation repair protein [Longimicrobiales bacterium]|nr:DNA alkylation repair protein [Longimicrobiales bacterium]